MATKSEKKGKWIKRIYFKPGKFFIINSLLILVLINLSVIAYFLYISDRFIYNVALADSKISFQTKSDAFRQISNIINTRLQSKLDYQYEGNTYSIDLTSAQPSVNYSKSLDEAFDKGHTGNFSQQIQDQFNSAVYGYQITPEITFDANAQVEKIAKAVEQTPQDATIWLDEQNVVHTKDGVTGTSLDKQALNKQISDYILFGYYPSVLPIKTTDPNFTTSEALQAKHALESIQKQPIELSYKDQKWTIDVPTLFYLLNLDKSPINDTENNQLLDNNKLDTYLKDIALKIDRTVEEPLFKFDSNNKRVTEFKPAQLGQEMDKDQTKQLIVNAIVNNEKAINLPVNVINPKIQTAEINNLGIQELIGQGVSNFAGSIPNRMYNVGLTASKINGVLIPPGEIFSFNKTVGEISGATGFKPAYVIKEGRTVLDDGGGVCQVSTTLFRAALNTGLPIMERTAHAYRVGYYEQGFKPGIDATIFYPSVDFKFKNDTPRHILVQAYVQGTTLYIDFYGTSDGRKVEMTTPVIGEQTPPPPDLRQDDPTLPRGEVKQVDWSAWGAKVSFKRTVTKDGQTIANETWRSNYRPWQAVYLVGTKDN